MSFLVGVKEAGEVLGWDRRKVSTYHLRGVLPKPVASLSSGPIWFRKQIEYYKDRKENSDIYYIIDDIVYECKPNNSLKESILTLEEVNQSTCENSIIYREKDINHLKSLIKNKDSIVQFLSFESINFLHDIGLLETDIFREYIEQYLLYENTALIKNKRGGEELW